MHTPVAFHMYAWIAFLAFGFLREIIFLALFRVPGEQKPMVRVIRVTEMILQRMRQGLIL